MSVVEAARTRVKNVFSNGCRVYMAFSAGKDSLCMAHVVYDLILHGEIDPKLLTVLFIDEEAIYESMYQMAAALAETFYFYRRRVPLVLPAGTAGIHPAPSAKQ